MLTLVVKPLVALHQLTGLFTRLFMPCQDSLTATSLAMNVLDRVELSKILSHQCSHQRLFRVAVVPQQSVFLLHVGVDHVAVGTNVAI